MHIDSLTPPEQRVLGCLIEKRFTTPDQYPLTLNSLRLACNQSTNRDPIVSYDEATVRSAAQRLAQYGLARLASGHTSRAVKYRHLAEDALGIKAAELALLCVLLLRGAQTLGELKARTERMVAFDSLSTVEAQLDVLVARGYAVRLDRRPGQKEERYAQLLGDDAPAAAVTATTPTVTPVSAPAYASAAAPAPAPAAPSPASDDRLVPTAPAPTTPEDHSDLYARADRLERELAQLKEQLSDLLA